METVFIIHGAYGHPQENWIPWLRKKLEARGVRVVVPHFPTPKHQTLEQWQQVFAPYIQEINAHTVLLGHSLGVAFLLRVLENLPQTVKAAFFVAGFLNALGKEPFDTLNQSFLEPDFCAEKIRARCPSFFLYHSDNDPYVETQQALSLGELLHTPSRCIKNAGHFNQYSGYDTFPLLWQDLVSLS
jgi:predicted alpha/beta hydrolase family esterase